MQKRRKEREWSVTMSTVSVEGGALLPTPFDKTAWLERVSTESERMARSPFAAAGTSSVTEETRRARPRRGLQRPIHRESCTSELFHLYSIIVSSRAHVERAKNLVALGYRPKSGVEEHAIYTMHRRTLLKNACFATL